MGHNIINLKLILLTLIFKWTFVFPQMTKKGVYIYEHGAVVIKDKSIKGFFFDETGNGHFTTAFLIYGTLLKEENIKKKISYKIKTFFPNEKDTIMGRLTFDYNLKNILFYLKAKPPGNVFVNNSLYGLRKITNSYYSLGYVDNVDHIKVIKKVVDKSNFFSNFFLISTVDANFVTGYYVLGQQLIKVQIKKKYAQIM